MNSGLDELPIRIQKAGGLPVFDSSLQEILELIRQDASMTDIATAVERDPGMASRVLRLANSAYYGMSREVSTLKMAMVLLGVRSLRSMVMSIGVVEVLNDDPDGTYVTSDFREHSFLAGRAASLITRLHRLPFSGEELVTGLVHDLGKLILLRAFPEIVAGQRGRFEGLRGCALVEVEREVFGVSHPQAGAWAAQEWRLPPEIGGAILCHHEPATERDVDLAAVAAAADEIAHYFCGPDTGELLPEEWAAHRLLSHPHLNHAVIVDELDCEPADLESTV